MKLLLIKLIRIFLAPFKVGSRNYYRARDMFYTNPAEHLHRVVKYVSLLDVDTGAYKRILDIGSADGATCLYFSSIFRDLIIHGFEPNPAMRDRLKAISNKHRKIDFDFIALSNYSGQSTLNITENHVSSSLLEIDTQEGSSLVNKAKPLKKESVPTSTLDESVDPGQKTLIMKLDTQGTELKILEHAVKTLRSTKFVVTEMMNHQAYMGSVAYHELDKFLREQGFELLDIIVSYRSESGLQEFDAIYYNPSL